MKELSDELTYAMALGDSFTFRDGFGVDRCVLKKHATQKIDEPSLAYRIVKYWPDHDVQVRETTDDEDDDENDDRETEWTLRCVDTDPKAAPFVFFYSSTRRIVTKTRDEAERHFKAHMSEKEIIDKNKFEQALIKVKSLNAWKKLHAHAAKDEQNLKLREDMLALKNSKARVGNEYFKMMLAFKNENADNFRVAKSNSTCLMPTTREAIQTRLNNKRVVMIEVAETLLSLSPTGGKRHSEYSVVLGKVGDLEYFYHFQFWSFHSKDLMESFELEEATGQAKAAKRTYKDTL